MKTAYDQSMDRLRKELESWKPEPRLLSLKPPAQPKTGQERASEHDQTKEQPKARLPMVLQTPAPKQHLVNGKPVPRERETYGGISAAELYFPFGQ